MELKVLSEVINTRLKEHSLAHAELKESFFDDYILVSHPDQTEGLGSEIKISSLLFGWWNIEYMVSGGGEIIIEMQIKKNGDDVNEIVNFVNEHTMHETPQEENVAEENKVEETEKEEKEGEETEEENKDEDESTENEEELEEEKVESKKGGVVKNKKSKKEIKMKYNVFKK